MARLTDIVRKIHELRDTFPGYDAPGHQEVLQQFREKYREAEIIRIGDMDYIVINSEYKSDDIAEVTDTTSPLFFTSINNNYAIIDTKNSSTLIDVIYSRIAYMQRDCETGAALPSAEKIKKTFELLVSEDEEIGTPQIERDEADGSVSKMSANIFQCQLIKDTGVSASQDVYSFLLKGGVVKEVSDSAIQKIHNTGTVRLLDEDNQQELLSWTDAIQEAVFEKYIKMEIDIQSITVRSIFEIKMSCCNVSIDLLNRTTGKNINSVYTTSYLAGENDEFDALNANIHVCNCCGHDLVDARNERMVYRLHTNMDAYSPKATEEAFERAKARRSKTTLMDHLIYAVGCADCLVECPECHLWHFDYEKLVGTNVYDNVTLVPGREFIKGLRYFGTNYCACREGIEWVFDEKSGSEEEHDVIPKTEMVFVNNANEKIADYEEYAEFYENEKSRTRLDNALQEKEFAHMMLSKFKSFLANKYEMDSDAIKVTSRDKCHTCVMCGGVYYGSLDDDKCAVCTELFEERRHMVTRVDGVVFMLSGSKKKRKINKYVVTKFGNLKKISSNRVNFEILSPENTEGTENQEAMTTTTV